VGVVVMYFCFVVVFFLTKKIVNGFYFIFTVIFSVTVGLI
jgi:hypothetical protein